MTVEFAVVLPVIALVLVTAIAGVLVVDRQGRLQVAAATAARALGRGDDELARSVLDRLAPGAAVDVRRADGLVCVTASRAVAGPFAAVPLRGDGCAAAGGA